MQRYSLDRWLWYPRTVAEFDVFPCESHLQAELASGWRGSDGSSCSFDSIFGVRVGETTRDYRPDLPAWTHDFRYRVIRRIRPYVSRRFARELRRAADRRHLLDLLDALERELEQPKLAAGCAIAGNRWLVLRSFGWTQTHRGWTERFLSDSDDVAMRYAGV